MRRESALAHHFGTFQLTDEPIDAPLHSRRCLEGRGPPERFRACNRAEV